MKTRNGYVSNSSSSSFLVPKEPSRNIRSIRLPKEIWETIAKNHVEWDGKKFDLSSSDEWWLTELVSDCSDEYQELLDIPNAVSYLEGNGMPYDCYEDEGENEFIKFKKGGCTFYALLSDFIDANGNDCIPDSLKLRERVRKILGSKTLNKSQKLDAISSLIDF